MYNFPVGGYCSCGTRTSRSLLTVASAVLPTSSRQWQSAQRPAVLADRCSTRWCARLVPQLSAASQTANLLTLRTSTRIAGCFPPYRARKASGAEIPEKWGKITKFPSPVRPPKMGKIGPKKGKNYSENTKFVIFR